MYHGISYEIKKHSYHIPAPQCFCLHSIFVPDCHFQIVKSNRRLATPIFQQALPACNIHFSISIAGFQSPGFPA